MIEVKNVMGNVSDEIVYAVDKTYVHTNITKDTELDNLYHYDEFQFDLNEDPTDLMSAQDETIADLMDEIESLCNELIGE